MSETGIELEPEFFAPHDPEAGALYRAIIIAAAAAVLLAQTGWLA